jgi:hypothetical protein
MREAVRLWISFSSLDARPILFRRRLDMAHPYGRVSMRVLCRLAKSMELFRAAERWREGGRKIG